MILIADDDERILRMLKDFLSFNGFKVITASDGKQALETFDENEIELILLDVMMPVYDGWIVCREIRKKSNVPIIMLTAKDSDMDQLFAFDMGVDDYVSKPFNVSLLLARMKRLLKNATVPQSDGKLRFKDIEVDTIQHSIRIAGVSKEFSPKEFELIEYFIRNKNKVISREVLFKVIWEGEYYGDTRTVDTHINRLRNKLGESASYLKTVRGFGYKLEE